MARKRRPNWRKIKRHYNYTVHDTARTLGCCKGTVRRWLKDGLPALTDQKPALILGDDLIAFLKDRAKPKRRCLPEECFCLKCREPRRMAGGMADLTDPTPTGGNLQALCEKCGTLMYKRVSHHQLAELKGVLEVQEPADWAREALEGNALCQRPAMERHRHITDYPEPRLNDHLEEAPEDHA